MSVNGVAAHAGAGAIAMLTSPNAPAAANLIHDRSTSYLRRSVNAAIAARERSFTKLSQKLVRRAPRMRGVKKTLTGGGFPPAAKLKPHRDALMRSPPSLSRCA